MNYIPVNEPLLKGNEKKYLGECIDTGWVSSEGAFVQEFEEQFAQCVGRKYGIAVTNGTAALDAAIDALELGKGDEVIMPTFTIISCIGQIIRSGAKPVFIDSDPVTWNMDVNQIEGKVNVHTKAIMVVHMYGLPADIDTVLDIAQRHNLKVIEDAAQMIGQTYKGHPCGSFGDISTFSFYSNKHITTGEGGMIVTNNEELAETCRSLRNLCFQTHERFVHERLGWNLRMTNLQAAIGLAQLEQLDEFVGLKRDMGSRYSKLLYGLPGVQLPKARTDYAENIYWIFGLVLDETFGFEAAEAIKRLAEKGIGCRPFFCPMHQQPVLQRMGVVGCGTYPVAERLYRRGFYIPSGMALTREQMEKVAEGVWEVLE